MTEEFLRDISHAKIYKSLEKLSKRFSSRAIACPNLPLS